MHIQAALLKRWVMPEVYFPIDGTRCIVSRKVAKKAKAQRAFFESLRLCPRPARVFRRAAATLNILQATPYG